MAQNKIEFSEEEIEVSNRNFEKMKKSGIIVTEAEFMAAVNGADKTPEYGFSLLSNKSTRRAKMWLLPNGALLCEQADKRFFVPPTYKFANLK